MHADFSGVFAREGMWAFEKCHQNLVKHLVTIHNLTEISLVRQHFVHVEGFAVLLKKLCDDREGVAARNPDDGNGAHAVCGGYGTNRIFVHDVDLHGCKFCAKIGKFGFHKTHKTMTKLKRGNGMQPLAVGAGQLAAPLLEIMVLEKF